MQFWSRSHWPVFLRTFRPRQIAVSRSFIGWPAATHSLWARGLDHRRRLAFRSRRHPRRSFASTPCVSNRLRGRDSPFIRQDLWSARVWWHRGCQCLATRSKCFGQRALSESVCALPIAGIHSWAAQPHFTMRTSLGNRPIPPPQRSPCERRVAKISRSVAFER